jgi:hypothetical protein
VRFLVDENLSPRLAELLVSSGHDALHVRALGLAAADDSVVLARAEQDNRVLVSADTDFGALLALGHRRGPSVIVFRRERGRRARRRPPSCSIPSTAWQTISTWEPSSRSKTNAFASDACRSSRNRQRSRRLERSIEHSSNLREGVISSSPPSGRRRSLRGTARAAGPHRLVASFADRPARRAPRGRACRGSRLGRRWPPTGEQARSRFW